MIFFIKIKAWNSCVVAESEIFYRFAISYRYWSNQNFNGKLLVKTRLFLDKIF